MENKEWKGYRNGVSHDQASDDQLFLGLAGKDKSEATEVYTDISNHY